ncbi:guanitoxin biosynthesis heme-dependent pre-guanitoxin N-hydroxylase GntA [Albibacterium profundi]|uniref:Guanitoxin biosynthesis heme-dependent pre-guanitoxin N-hydroxylase GntA n=1 Tax=Albibacterium profundi TaxID=3134906 RepID=A0ABV5CG99_9SPHI
MSVNRNQTYFRPEEIDGKAPQEIQLINQHFVEKIDDTDYPCVGAKSALHTNQYRFGLYGAMGDKKTTESMAVDLKRYIDETVEANSQYMSMIAVFTDQVANELDFEQKLWLQLQELHDSEKDQTGWDPSVENDPESDDFSFSFNETAFFVVGLHPHSSRKARQFEFCAMAFNLHRQFEQLREADQYEKMKQVIRDREINYQGSINPMLNDHGEGSEAAQYSGRKVEGGWKCPFHP